MREAAHPLRETDRTFARALTRRRIAEVRKRNTAADRDALFIALDDGAVVEVRPLVGLILLRRTYWELESERKTARGTLRKFYARALNRLRSWETGWNMPRNRRVSVRERKRVRLHVRVRPHDPRLRPSPTHHA